MKNNKKSLLKGLLGVMACFLVMFSVIKIAEAGVAYTMSAQRRDLVNDKTGKVEWTDYLGSQTVECNPGTSPTVSSYALVDTLPQGGYTFKTYNIKYTCK